MPSSNNNNASLADTLLDWARALLIVPINDYNAIRPHHVVLLYYGSSLVTSTVYKHCSDYIGTTLSKLSEKCIGLVYLGLVPDFLIRMGIRIQLEGRLIVSSSATVQDELAKKMQIVQDLKEMPIAVDTDTANEQHYEVPAKFYDYCLGPHKKYSCGLWSELLLEKKYRVKSSLFDNITTFNAKFAQSELDMLSLYCQRAQVENGMKIVDLGCGWGSLTLYLAENYPDCKITGISNSHSQREYIMQTAKDRGLKVENINIITCNVANDKGALDSVKDNDLVMTVEMLEHMKNYHDLLQKIHNFLKPRKGRLFIHIFTHKDYAYHFESGSWMSDNFFTGGTMPSDDLLLYFGSAVNLRIINHWRVNGQHYEKTSNGWLRMLDEHWKNGNLKPVLQQAYGEGKEYEWYVNWRLFFLACAELWGYKDGNEWCVSHYLFERN